MEFAIVALLLVTMILGVMEFGRMWAIQASLAQASRDAARTVAIEDDPALAYPSVDGTFAPDVVAGGGGTLSVPPAVQSGVVGDPSCRWTVSSTYTVATLTGFLGDDWTISAKGVMRCNG